MHLFWPQRVRPPTSKNSGSTTKAWGIAVGCQTNERFISVCDVLPIPAETLNLSNLLASYNQLASSIAPQDVEQHFAAPLRVIGIIGNWNTYASAAESLREIAVEPRQRTSLPNTLDTPVDHQKRTKRRRRKSAASASGNESGASSTDLHPPKQRQLLLLSHSQPEMPVEFLGLLPIDPEAIGASSIGIEQEINDPVSRLTVGLVLYDHPGRNQFYTDLNQCNRSLALEEPTSLELVFRQINMANAISKSFRAALRAPQRPDRTAVTTVHDSASTYSQPLLYFFSFILVHIVSALSFFIMPIQYILSLRLADERPALKSLSLLAEQVDRRLSLLCTIEKFWKDLHSPSLRWQNTGTVARRWVTLYNYVLIILVDWALGLFIVWVWWNYIYGKADEHTPLIDTTASFTSSSLWGHEKMRQALEWLQGGRPAGVKLNIPASNALSSLFLFYSSQWAVLVSYWADHIPTIFYLFPMCGLFGLSFMLSAIFDTIFFVNMHVYWMYTGMSRLYNVQLQILQSLWLLFRGKKRNVLKDRIDSCDYSVDQFLLGTVLFSALAFLLPTVVVYHFLFFVAMSVVTTLRLVFKLVNLLLNQFPVFSITLRLLGATLSDGVVVEVAPEMCTKNATVSKLKTVSSSIGADFTDMAASFRKMISPYAIGKVLKAAFSGAPLR